MKTKLYEWNKSTTIVSIRLKTNSGTTCSFCGLNGMRIKSEPKASRYFRVIHIIVRIKCVLWLSRWELLIGFILEWSGVEWTLTLTFTYIFVLTSLTFQIVYGINAHRDCSMTGRFFTLQFIHNHDG